MCPASRVVSVWHLLLGGGGSKSPETKRVVIHVVQVMEGIPQEAGVMTFSYAL